MAFRMISRHWPAQQLVPPQRQTLAVRVLGGAETVSQSARQQEVSRKFVYQQVRTAEQALKRHGRDLRTLGQRPNRTRAACDAAIRLSDDVALLLDWLCRDVLAVAGPGVGARVALYDFIVAELKARAPLCPHQLQPICRTFQNQRDDFLAFARALDQGLKGTSPNRAPRPTIK